MAAPTSNQLLVSGTWGHPIPHKLKTFTYVGSTNNIATITYTDSRGIVVATETFTYVGAGASDNDNVATITLSTSNL